MAPSIIKYNPKNEVFSLVQWEVEYPEKTLAAKAWSRLL